LEQIAGAASLIATLLAECPAVTILATSRERLHLRAEQRFKVPPLELGAAVELFVRRAQSVESAFEPMPEQEAVIAAICHRLDCLPLALELCAAQIELFSPAQLLTQLRKRPLDILVDGAHDLPPPQRTLRQAIERSYSSLNAEEQRLFRTLGVFVGGFDLAMVMDFGFAETTLYALLNKSLVSTEIRGMSERRFLLLETIREYAHERLSVVNELMSVSKQHADYFFKLVEEAEQHFRGSAERQWFERLTCDYDNLRTALDWLIRFNVASGQQMAGQLAGFWYGAALFGEGRGWLTRALAASSLPTPSRANALQAASKLAQDQNDNLQAYQLAQESLTLFEAQENPAGCAGALNVMGWALADMEQPAQALSHFEQSLHKARQARHLGHIAFACTNIANMLIRLGASDKRILPLLRESKPLYHQINRISGQAYVLRTEARLYLVAGDYARAALLIQEALSLLRPLGVQWEVAATLEELADSVWRMGDDAAACAYL
ncbi:MAG: hypothetical protein KDE31_10570, partial [Caldilineaceae bacterium]|nr:hypothetical protein [Caldilineaceae bacterium]